MFFMVCMVWRRSPANRSRGLLLRENEMYYGHCQRRV